MLFSTEMVNKYHPDKFADQISDAILTYYLKHDPYAHVACECLAKGSTIVLGGEITSTVDGKQEHRAIVEDVASRLGYHVDGFVDLITPQSVQIGDAVNSCRTLGAGDQGMMFGYACRGGRYHLPYGQELAIGIIGAIEADVSENPSSILKGDAKTQVTTDLETPGYRKDVDTVLVSVCHKEGVGLDEVKAYVKRLLEKVPGALDGKLLINPAGVWTLGGPDADCGLTGRKIVCDQYGGYAPVGGGAFSGKDPTKVDRSGAYMARKIACAVVDEFDVDSCEIQLAYGIGLSEPLSVNVKTSVPELDNYISKWISEKYDLTPKGMIEYLHLLDLDYYDIAKGCHMVHFN